MKKFIILIVFLCIGFLGGFLALHFFSFNYIEKFLLADDRSDLIPIEIIEEKEIIIKENEAIVERIQQTQRAIIGITTTTRTATIQGSGLIVSADGLVVTLSDIIPRGGNYVFFINGEKVSSFQVIKRDTQTGLALVKMEKSGLPTLEFENIDRIKNGQSVFLIGTVFNQKNEPQKSVNQGIIKRFDNYIETNIFEERKLLGSTLFSVEGKVLGLNLVNQRGEIYSIPISKIQEFIGL